MSVATEFPPVVHIPDRARICLPAKRLARVTTLHQPSRAAVAAPLRLTRRGVVVLAAVVAVLAVTLIGAARLSAPSGDTRTSPVPDTVTVQPGDSLWSIAGRLTPQRDPRAEVADLERVNHLSRAVLVPGQVLRTH